MLPSINNWPLNHKGLKNEKSHVNINFCSTKFHWKYHRTCRRSRKNLHNHLDHTGGLGSVLGKKAGIPVYFGNSFPESFSQNISNNGATPIRVNEPIEICENIYLVFGGFHLSGYSDTEINQIIQEFKALGVEKCGPTHCTGERPIALFEEAYGENDIPMGVGQVIQISEKTTTNIKESDDRKSYIPDGFKLNQNYPNSFCSSTIIQYTIYKSASIDLKIFNFAGQEIETLINAYQTAGDYDIIWQPEGLSSGIYFCRLQAGKFSETKKLVFQKSGIM